MFTVPGGSAGEYVKCNANKPSCSNFSFQSCEEFTTKDCDTAANDQDEAKMQAQAKAIMDALKPTFD